MNVLTSFFEALDSLRSNKTRSALTILGIVIGVGAVIAMISIGRGAENSITGSIQGIGTNLLFVLRTQSSDVTNPQPLTLEDAEAISDPFLAPSVAHVAPMLEGQAKVTYDGESQLIIVSGITPEFEIVHNYQVTEGEFISEDQLLSRSSVALIGPDAADNLFGRETGIVGETIRIEGQPFRVIGVLESKGGSTFTNQDNVVLIPLTTAQTRLFHRSKRNQVDLLIVEAYSPDAVQSASDEVSEILRNRHKTKIGADDFTILKQQDFIETASMITNILTIFLGGVAAISLLVGGIGIMNIMLVSVTERTREIGLRKALGARRVDILVQFLTESATLSLIGGILGILLGWGISYVVGLIAAANKANITPTVTLDTILLATLFSTAVGLFFGLYPANRAAGLEPVEALRYE